MDCGTARRWRGVLKEKGSGRALVGQSKLGMWGLDSEKKNAGTAPSALRAIINQIASESRRCRKRG